MNFKIGDLIAVETVNSFHKTSKINLGMIVEIISNSDTPYRVDWYGLQVNRPVYMRQSIEHMRRTYINFRKTI